MKYTLSILLFCTQLIFAENYNSAKVSKIINEVKVLQSKKSPRKAQVNEAVTSDQLIVTGRRSRSELTFPDKSIVRLGANTSFSFKNNSRDLELKSGSVLFQLPKNSKPVNIHTGSVTAAIQGTTILLEYNPKTKVVTFIVLEGDAVFTTPKGKREVKGGELVHTTLDINTISETLEIDTNLLLSTSILLDEKLFGKLPSTAQEAIEKVIKRQEGDLEDGELLNKGDATTDPLDKITDSTEAIDNRNTATQEPPVVAPPVVDPPVVEPPVVEPPVVEPPVVEPPVVEPPVVEPPVVEPPIEEPPIEEPPIEEPPIEEPPIEEPPIEEPPIEEPPFEEEPPFDEQAPF